MNEVTWLNLLKEALGFLLDLRYHAIDGNLKRFPFLFLVLLNLFKTFFKLSEQHLGFGNMSPWVLGDFYTIIVDHDLKF